MNNTERIDRFLRGDLPEEEKKALETELSQNADLASELALQKDMEAFLRKQTQRAALRDQLQAVGGEFFQTSEKAEPGRIVSLPRRQTLRWVIGIAATVTLLLVARFLLQPNLYDQFAQHPPLAMIEKSNEAQDNLAAMEAAFNQQDYARALPLLEAYQRQKPEDLQVELYLGICWLETQQYAKANAVFQKISQTESSFKDYGQWYLALSYLKQGNKTACRKILLEVPAESEFAAKAQNLLKRL
ncbi:tetratricopeptide repeat protein [Haliscomenobacter sp.]|uniref:tetratricopeptide repeat protein n=1 Tax=Haliscomenobacter sp. TaxID=2717303 RepID=UPI003364E59A